jgi:hypothetical protein
MSLDLDSRLRDYGTDLDTAIDAPAALALTPASSGSRWVRCGVPLAAAAMVAVATGILIAGRSPERSAPATAATESTVDTDREAYFRLVYGPGDWGLVEPAALAPVVLADGIVPYYSLTDEAATLFDGGMFPGSGYWLLACTEWNEASDGAIECTAVESSARLSSRTTLSPPRSTEMTKVGWSRSAPVSTLLSTR